MLPVNYNQSHVDGNTVDTDYEDIFSVEKGSTANSIDIGPSAPNFKRAGTLTEIKVHVATAPS